MTVVRDHKLDKYSNNIIQVVLTEYTLYHFYKNKDGDLTARKLPEKVKMSDVKNNAKGNEDPTDRNLIALVGERRTM